MWGLLFFLAVVAVAVAGAAVKKHAAAARFVPASRTLPFETAPSLFSPAERFFFGVLEQAIGDNYCVMAKVRLGDVIQPHPGQDRAAFTAALGMINRKLLDYVICRKADLVTVGAIALADDDHRRPARRQRDDFVDQALHSAGIPLVRFPERTGYALEDVKLQLASSLALSLQEIHRMVAALPPAEAPAEQAARAGAGGEFAAVPGDLGPRPVAGPPPAPGEICPDCGEPMAVRRVLRGPHADQHFWVCARFPQCRGVKPRVFTSLRVP